MDHQKQGEDFLKKTGVKMTVKRIGYKPYFQDDKESRDVYRITLSRNGRRFSFQFGQSINSTEKGEEPTAYDVLTCIEKYDPEDFHNWCGNLGYDEDSRKAEKIYKTVVKQWEKVSAFFTTEEIEQLAWIN